MEVNTYTKGNNLIIVEIKDNIDMNNFNIVQKILRDACTNIKGKKLVIDMKNVPYIDSSGINAFMITFKEIHAAGGEFCLWNVNDHVKEILKLTHIDKIFNICSEL